MVEGCRESHRAHHHELGRCHRLCPRSRLFRQYLFLPELHHSQQFTGEKPPRGRLSLREQDELRPTHPADTASHASVPAHAAVGRKELHRKAAVGIQARDTQTRQAERHRGVQLSGRRHDSQQPCLSDRLLYPMLRHRQAALSAGGWLPAQDGHPLGTRPAQSLPEVLYDGAPIYRAITHGIRKDRPSACGSPRELRETLRGPARTDVADKGPHDLPGRRGEPRCKKRAVQLSCRAAHQLPPR